ncbi:MAG TPA: cytochrome c oxidase subunit 3 [Gammaproteobacteria bacterium]|nr:cytochrome c oxidase subunit 3 [Gammaproteobacteria bacterium]
MSESHSDYYLPEPSRWPLIGSVGLFFLFGGLALALNGVGIGSLIMVVGFAGVLIMVFGWFSTVIQESESGRYNSQVDKSFRWGMGWFIFSEVMFFAAFFGALFYARMYSVPWLGGEGAKVSTHTLLWPAFEALWPLLKLPDPKGFTEAAEPMGASGLPAINTLLLLSSGATVTWAHWGLRENNRRQLILGLILTIALGLLFLVFQGIEYSHAYSELNLRLTSGIYGTTFFLLTGFHGAHVTLGVIMLSVILLRSIKGHFTPDRHFAFEGVAWYWHFVDVVWIFVFATLYLSPGL